MDGEYIPPNVDDPVLGPPMWPHDHIDPHWWKRGEGADAPFVPPPEPDTTPPA